MSEIIVTVSGPVGCGKSAIAGEIEIALRAVGVPVRFSDEKEARSEKNMTGADWAAYIEMYEPSVVLVEKIGVAATDEEAASDGVCQEPDGCPTEKAVLMRFWRQHNRS